MVFRPRKAFAKPAAEGLHKPIAYLLALSFLCFLLKMLIIIGEIDTWVDVLLLLLLRVFVAAIAMLPATLLVAFWVKLCLLIIGRKAGFQAIFRMVCYASSCMAFTLISYTATYLASQWTPPSQEMAELWPAIVHVAIPALLYLVIFFILLRVVTWGIASICRISILKALLPVAASFLIPFFFGSLLA